MRRPDFPSTALLRASIALAAILAMTALQPQHLEAQASLAAEDIIDDVSVPIEGQAEVFTLFRDARNADQWYYVPNRPRLVVHQVAGKAEPEFSLLRYQFPDPGDAAKLIEEGILQFSASLAAPPEAFDVFRAAIEKRTKRRSPRISAIPFKSADVAMYTYAGPGKKSTLVAEAPYGSGIAPLFASQSMAFSMPLTKIGSDVMEELVTGGTGVPIAISFTFNALTPPAGFKVTVDWDQTFTHYSKDEAFRAQASWFGWFGASYDRKVQSIREELINKGCIKVATISGEAFKQEDIDKYLQPILARINNELIEAAKPPTQIDPALAAPVSAGGWFGSAGYSVAIKDVVKVKKGSEVWEMTNQQIVERKTITQGFMGIGRFDPDVRKKLITTVPGSGFTSAYFMLPSPALAAELGVSSLDLQVSLITGPGQAISQVVRWVPGASWKDITGTARTTLAFGTAALTADTAKTSTFQSKLTVTTDDQVLVIPNTMPAFNGQTAMPGINRSLFEVVAIDLSPLDFAALGQGDILRGNATIRIAGKEYTRELKPSIVNGKLAPPPDLRVLFQRDNGGALPPITARITFQAKGGKKYGWKYNDQDFRSVFDGLSIAIDPVDLVQR